MSDSSDEETVERVPRTNQPPPPPHSQYIEQLVNQNKMQSIALSKASHLIELLNVELQVQKSSHQQSLKNLEEEICRNFEIEMRRLRERCEFLERQLKKKKNTSNDKTVRQSAMVRTNSSHSLENKEKRRSIIKTIGSHEDSFPSLQFQSFSVAQKYYKDSLLSYEQWQKSVINDLGEMVNIEYEDMGGYIQCIENIADQMNDIFTEKSRKQINKTEELFKIIQNQQQHIVSMTEYQTKLQDLISNLQYRLASFVSMFQERLFDRNFTVLTEFQPVIRNSLQKYQQQWRYQYSCLQKENIQLKNIMDSMITLVKQEKKFAKC